MIDYKVMISMPVTKNFFYHGKYYCFDHNEIAILLVHSCVSLEFVSK